MPDRLIATDVRFWLLSEALASYAGDAGDPPIHEGDRLQAAVSVVIRGRGELDFLLIKRARSERDPWSGHMALPGGRRDDSDGDLLHTARRETLEETGVDLDRVGAALAAIATGATLGLLSFSKLLRVLLSRYHDLTLAALAGVMLGSLRRIWPFKSDMTPGETDFKLKLFENRMPDAFDGDLATSLLLLVAGCGVVLALDRLSIDDRGSR